LAKQLKSYLESPWLDRKLKEETRESSAMLLQFLLTHSKDEDVCMLAMDTMTAGVE